MTGGCGFCSGIGQDQDFSKLTISPLNAASSSVHKAFMARTRSRISLKRVSYAAPWLSISSTFQPPPIPRVTRPFDIMSRLATTFAVTIGSRCGIRLIPVPIFRLVVAAAAKDSEMNGSRVCAYSFGSSPPPGQGDFRLIGICVCSGTNSEAKPRSSSARANSSMLML